MRVLLLLLAGLFGSSNAASLLVKRAPDKVVDGSFESVPNSSEDQYDFTAGGWTFSGDATMYRNNRGDDGSVVSLGTPYGKKYAHMISDPTRRLSGSITQTISGLTLDKVYTIEYRQRYWMPPVSGQCDTFITYGSQLIEHGGVGASSHGQAAWAARAETFKPKTSSGVLKFLVRCDVADDDGFDIHFDRISIT